MKIIQLFTQQFFLIMRVICIGLLVVLVPRYILISADNAEQVINKNTSFRLGIENITPHFIHHFVTGAKKPLRVALVTNHTAVDQSGCRSLDILKKHGINIRRIYAPEHGFAGACPAEKRITDSVDETTGIPVVSFYKGNSQLRTLTPEELQDVDAFFFEMQDCGMRHYTYFPTLYKFMELAAQHNKKIVVFDRPNPLGGIMEGPLVDKGNISFISIASYPVRHGMTIGELAMYCNAQCLNNKAQLYIVPMKNYNRLEHACSLLTALSPNLKTLDACKGYSFLGMAGDIEQFNVGVDTDNAFQFIGLDKSLNVPMSEWYHLKEKLKKHGIHAKGYTYYHPKKQKYYRGLKIRIDDVQRLSSCAALLEIINHFKKYGLQYKFGPSFNKAIGINELKDYMLNKVSYQQLINKINNDLTKFYAGAEGYFLYKPYPQKLLLQ